MIDDSGIDTIFERSANTPNEIDAVILARVSASMASSLRPVRPIAPSWMLISGLILIVVAIAIAGAYTAGLYGIRRLSGLEIGAIFSALGIFTWLAATISVSEMIPGSVRRINPAMLLVVGIVAWAALDAALFRDYRLGAFVPQGISCLRGGLEVAAPTGIAGWLMLRRGFALKPAMAGLSAGTLAGLAGLIMLEIHCPNFRLLHIMIWHTAVIPVSGLVGAALGYASAARKRNAAELMQ